MANKPVSHPDSDAEIKRRDRIALVVSIAFVALIGFMGYRFFNSATSDDSGVLPDVVSREETMEEGEQQEEGEGTQNNGTANGNASGGNGSRVSVVWTANDYTQGDIDAGDYTVVRGDTLWEIAEAVYGDGAQWGKILNANSSDIGYLPSGSQALIVPGQVLSIPQ